MKKLFVLPKQLFFSQKILKTTIHFALTWMLVMFVCYACVLCVCLLKEFPAPPEYTMPCCRGPVYVPIFSRPVVCDRKMYMNIRKSILSDMHL